MLFCLCVWFVSKLISQLVAYIHCFVLFVRFFCVFVRLFVCSVRVTLHACLFSLFSLISLSNLLSLFAVVIVLFLRPYFVLCVRGWLLPRC